MRTLRLLAFQESVIDQLDALFREGHREIGLTSGTGSGKTVMSMGFLSQVLVEMGARTHIRCAVVLVHQTNIGVNWHWKKKTLLERPGYGPPIEVINLTQKPRKERTMALVEHLEAEGRPDRPVLICTYATLRKAVEEGLLPEDLSHVMFVNDEAHHVPYQERVEDNGKVSWADSRMECARRGATSLTVTATDFRARTEMPVHGNEQAVVRVPSSVLIEEGCRPQITQIRVRALRAHATYEQMRSDDATRTGIVLDDQDFDACVQQWIDDRFPKGVFKAQSIFQASQIIEALLRNVPGLKREEILDASGTETSDKERTERAVYSEQNQTTAVVSEKDGTTEEKLDVRKSQFKAVVACQRFVEGTDWPFCSHVYVVGIPGSLVTVLQLTGRALRDKTRILGYEETYPEYLQRSVITFFVPRLDKTELVRRAQDLTKLSVLVGLCSENFDIGRHFLDINLSLRQAVRGLNVTWNVMPRWQREIDKVVNLSTPEKLQVVQHVLAEKERLTNRLEREPSVPEMISHLMTEGGTTSMERIKNVVVYCNETAKHPDAPENLQKMMNKAVRSIVKACNEAPEDQPLRIASLFRFEFEQIANELGDLTVPFGDQYLGLKSELEKATFEEIDEKAKKVMARRLHYNKLTQELLQWRDANLTADVPKDLSEIFGYPKGTYKLSRLQSELRKGAIPGQPEEVCNWKDFVYDIGLR